MTRNRALAISLSICLLAVGLSGQSAKAQALGAVIDPEAYAAVPKAAPLSRGDFTEIPSHASLKKFTPTPGNQGTQGSCVGWATAYAARTVIAAQTGQITPSPRTAFSPAYIYNQINQGGCGNGSIIREALELMTDQGVMPLSAFPYTEKTCSALPSQSERAAAGAYRIGGQQRLFGERDRNRHIPVRRALAAGHPVVIAMKVPASFNEYRGGLFSPTPSEAQAAAEPDWYSQKLMLGGHAMTVVGYDDEGGWFEIINSWDQDWGEDGYLRISYSEFNALVMEGYEVFPPPPPPAPRVEDMHLALRFLDLEGRELTAHTEDANWVIDKPMASGTRFRVEARPGELQHLYVLGSDSSGQLVELFPRSGQVSPMVNAGNTLLLPGPTEDYFTRLDETVGVDAYVVLAAKRPIDIAGVTDAMASNGSDSFWDQLRDALGTRLVDPKFVTPSGSGIGLAAASGDQDVVAAVVLIDHIAPNPEKADIDPPKIVLTTPTRENFDSLADGLYVVSSHELTIEGRAQDDSDIASVSVEGAFSLRQSTKGPFRAEIDLPDGPGPHRLSLAATDVAGNSTTLDIELLVRP